MKVTLFSVFFPALLTATLFLPIAHAQDAPQWHLPEAATARLGKGTISAIAYSPDGSQLAVGCLSGDIWIYDASTGAEVAVLAKHTGVVSSVAFSPDGAILASGGNDGKLYLWDVNTGQHQKTLESHDFRGSVNDVAFSPDGQTLASGVVRAVILWNVNTGQQQKTLIGEAGWVQSIAFSPDGQTLASGSSESAVHLWDVNTGQQLQILTGHEGWVQSIAFSPDGQTLASGAVRAVILWNVNTGQQLRTFTGREDVWMWYAVSVAFSPDGRTLASGDWASTVQLWDVNTGRHQRTLEGHRDRVYSIAFSPDGQMLASGGEDGTLRLWNVNTGQQQKILTRRMGSIEDLAFSPDGQMLASRDSAGTVWVWDVVTRQHKTTLALDGGWINSIAFSPDGRTLATSGGGGLRLWDVASWQYKVISNEHANSIVFSPDGRTLASGSSDGTVWLWDLVSGQHKATLLKHTMVRSVAFSPDGKTLASIGYHGSVWLWDVVSGQRKTTLPKHTTYGINVAFSPDGRMLASKSYDEIRLWDAATGEHKASITDLNNDAPVVFSPDGRTLASHGNGFDPWVQLWDAATGGLKTTLTGHTTYALSVAFSPDGGTLASGGPEGIIYLWKPPPSILNQSKSKPGPMTIRLIYLCPSDRAPRPNIDTELDTLIRETQFFYAEQMESRGFGRKTFLFETDADGNAVVHHVEGQFADAYYQSNSSYRVEKEIEKKFDMSQYVYLIAVDVSNETLNDGRVCGVGGISWSGWTGEEVLRANLDGTAVIPASGGCFNVRVTAHELGHAFALGHDFRDDTYVMAYGTQSRLSNCAAEWLDAHPFFNRSQNGFNQTGFDQEGTTIEMLSQRDARLQFRVTDADGLHQAQLIAHEDTDTICGVRDTLYDYKTLNGNPGSVFEFINPKLTTRTNRYVTLQVIDLDGNITQRRFPVEEPVLVEDVNQDGSVDNIDWQLVAAAQGQDPPADPRTDVNGDGKVGVEDILLVAGAIDADRGAPSLYPATLEMFTASIVQQWLSEARYVDLTDPILQRGILVLERLLAALVPKETALLPNYPNPFNPETWIPYQLSKPADVTVSIYAANGSLIQTLALGNQSTGIYESRSRAAYWDGKNALGEPVASGVYFYTLSAGDFTATRKMIIRK